MYNDESVLDIMSQSSICFVLIYDESLYDEKGVWWGIQTEIKLSMFSCELEER